MCGSLVEFSTTLLKDRFMPTESFSKSFALNALTICLGLVFLYGGLYKLYNPSAAELALTSLDVPDLLSRIIVALVTVVELSLGGVLLFRSRLRDSLVFAGSTLFVFTIYLWYLSTLSHPPSCGCLGLTGIFENTRQAAVFGILRNVFLLIMVLLAYKLASPKPKATST